MFRILLFVLIVIGLFSSCEDKVREYNGFTQSELEYLLSGEEFKAWNLMGIDEGETSIELDECQSDNFLIFLGGSTGDPKPLLYAYNTNICDSLDFCLQHPEFCLSDTTLCGSDPEFCASLEAGVLYIGSWYVKAPFITNNPADTLVLAINDKSETAYIPNVNAENVTIQYRRRTGENGEIITEYYYFPLPIDE
jgi:hypothetical protein